MPAAVPAVPAGVPAAELVEQFRSAYGRRPDGIWAAPGRVNLIGEHTDYTGGLVLPFALDRRTTVGLALRDDGLARARTSQGLEPVTMPLSEVAPGRVRGWAALPLGVAWALGQAGGAVPGFDLLVTSDLPMGAGLSSSAALSCAVALGLAELTGAVDSEDRRALAAIARRAENDVAGVPTGVMDQLASLYGLAGTALLLDCRNLRITPLRLDLEAHDLVLLVIDTGVTHRLVGSEYGARRADCERAAALLRVASLRDVALDDLAATSGRLGERIFRRARHVITENLRVSAVAELLAADRPGEIGPALSASHLSLRNDQEVSGSELDLAVQAAQAAGALGARMVGGGFGGSVLALIHRDDAERVDAAVTEAFLARGWARPRSFQVLPADGARRLPLSS